VGRNVTKEFEAALSKKRIIPFTDATRLIDKELTAAADDLAEAKNRFGNERYKYATITAYYSMFHSARALLYSKGYREKSHYYLLVALRALFVETGLIPEKLAQEFHEAMVLREEADYHGTFSESGAQSTVDAAKKLLDKAKEVLMPSR
jgi:uncharacterized protein (UPF0332 family)